jgi:hypothetical protein
LQRPLSVALKKQNSKDSNSPIPLECRARLQKVNDINGYEVLAKDTIATPNLCGNALNVSGEDSCPIAGILLLLFCWEL